MFVGSEAQTGWQTTYVTIPTLTRTHANTTFMHAMQSPLRILSHRLKEEKMEWEEVKGIEWVVVGEKDGERGRGRVGVSGTWLSI